MAAAPPPSEEAQAELEALLNGPAGAPPPGIRPNFDNPPSLDIVIHLSFAICITFSSLAVLIRIYTRYILLRSIGYDDHTSVVSLLGLIAYLVPGLLGLKAGAGIDMWNLRLEKFFELLYWVNIATLIYGPVVFFVKLSILLQYSRVFNPTGKGNLPMFVAIQICIWSIFLFHLIFIFFDIFQCTPREYIWNKLETTGHCRFGYMTYKNSGVFNVISDFAILILPVPSIWTLQMSLRKKLWTTGVFAIGLLTCLTSIIRTYYIWRIAESPDQSYFFALFGQWSGVELSAGIIVGCFPVFPKFFQHVGPKTYKMLSRIKTPFATYKPGPSASGTRDDPYTRLHRESFTPNELEGPGLQAEKRAAARVATRPDDLEHGDHGS